MWNFDAQWKKVIKLYKKTLTPPYFNTDTLLLFALFSAYKIAQ